MRVLIFGGTTEGRRLAVALSRATHAVTLVVATPYAEEMVADSRDFTVLVKRLDEHEMTDYLKNNPQDAVVDATHPFAEIATRGIRNACRETGTECLRLIRPETKRHPNADYVDNASEAVELLNRESGTVFLTVGSKALEHFTRINDFAARCVVRILPMPESLDKAIALGFRNKNIICMQGPFDEATNLAMLSATKANFLVTKDSGEHGGIDAKIAAAMRCGCRVIVIKRPAEENGFSFEELCEHFGVMRNSMTHDEPCRTFFPLFFDMKGKRVLVVGGGKIAERRIGILMRFGAEIIVVSPDITEQLREMSTKQAIKIENRNYVHGDIERFKPFLVIAATDSRETNDAVANDAKSNNVFVSVADCREQCDCYFPAIAENESFLAGIVSKNGDHRGVREKAAQIRQLLNSNEATR